MTPPVGAAVPPSLISVVVPVRDEQTSIAPLVTNLTAVLEPLASFEVIFVDDGSVDDTWGEVRRTTLTDARVRGLSLSRNFGKDAAIIAGLKDSHGDAVIVMDGDLQHPPALLPAMISHWIDGGVDVVAATKRTRGGQPFPVRLGARVFNRSFSRLTGVDLTDATDLRLLSRPAVDALLALPERAVFFRGTSSWIGFRTAFVEFDVPERQQGGSSFTFRSLTRFAVRSLTSFTSAPLHLVTAVGVGFGAVSLLLGVQTLVRWLRGDAVEGFTTVILLLLVTGSAILVGLGIIGEYLARIHEEVKARPRYLIADRTADRSGEP